MPNPDAETIILATLGYEGLTPSAYIDTALSAGVQTVVDVRRIPMSRRPGFSKKRLAEACAAHGLAYVHMVELGTPRDVLYRYRETHDRAGFEREMNGYLDTQAPAIRALADLASSSVCCLLCLEADPASCHRRYVAERVRLCLGERHCEVVDLHA